MAAPHNMWDLSSPTGTEPMPPALEGQVLTPGPQGKLQTCILYIRWQQHRVLYLWLSSLSEYLFTCGSIYMLWALPPLCKSQDYLLPPHPHFSTQKHLHETDSELSTMGKPALCRASSFAIRDFPVFSRLTSCSSISSSFLLGSTCITCIIWLLLQWFGALFLEA